MTIPRRLLFVTALVALVRVPVAAQTTLAEASAAAKKIQHAWPVSGNAVPEARPVVDEAPAPTSVAGAPTTFAAAPRSTTPITAAPSIASAPTAVVPTDLSVAADGTSTKDAASWKERSRVLHAVLTADETARAEVATRLASYRQLSSRSLVVQAKILDTVDELGRATARVHADQLAIADFEEEARRANVPPGWLRLP